VQWIEKKTIFKMTFPHCTGQKASFSTTAKVLSINIDPAVMDFDNGSDPAPPALAPPLLESRIQDPVNIRLAARAVSILAPSRLPILPRQQKL
jgi:hypothetical protein